MARPARVVVLVLAVMLSVASGLWASVEFGEAGVVPPTLFPRGFIPYVARDGVAQPGPTPVSQPRPQQTMRILVDMVINQPALVSGGHIPLKIRGSAEGVAMRGAQPTSYHGALMIEAHQADACTWEEAERLGILPLDVSVSQETTLFPPRTEYILKFTELSWHYNVTCGKNPPVVVRFPAGSGEESFLGWLGLILAGQAGPAGLKTELPEYTGDQPNSGEVIHNRATVTGNNQFGTVTITFEIVGSR